MTLTVHFPDPATLPEQPIVWFAKADGAFSRGHFPTAVSGSVRLPSDGSHAQLRRDASTAVAANREVVDVVGRPPAR